MPFKDNTLYESASGATSNGAGQFLFAGMTLSAKIRRTAMAFDIAGNIPAGSMVVSVSLRMNVSKTETGAEKMELYRLLADWGEGTSNAGGNAQGGGGGGATSKTGDATWIHRFFDTEMWQTPGGDFSPTASATASVSTINGIWGPTEQMTADVQGWLDDPASNYGWLVLGNEEEVQTAKRFYSRETGLEENLPMLVIEYLPA